MIQETKDHPRLALEEKQVTPELEAWVAELVGLFGDPLYKHLLSRLPSPDAVNDVWQETFLRVMQKARPGTIQYPRAYLFRIANNIIVDSMRREQVRKREQESAGQRPETWDGDGPEQYFHCDELLQAYTSAMEELPERCRLAFQWRRFEQQSTPEIAERLSCSHRMVQKYLAEALAHLHKRLNGFMEQVGR